MANHDSMTATSGEVKSTPTSKAEAGSEEVDMEEVDTAEKSSKEPKAFAGHLLGQETANVPCRYTGCLEVFKSHQRANDHAARGTEGKFKPTPPIGCGWATMQKGFQRPQDPGKTREEAHRRPEYPVGVSQGRYGYGRRCPDYYSLANHEQKCRLDGFQKAVTNKSKKPRLWDLNVRAEDEDRDSKETTPATIIFAAWSSNDALQEWGCGETALIDSWAISWLGEKTITANRSYMYLLPAQKSNRAWVGSFDVAHDDSLKRNIFRMRASSPAI